MEVLQGTTPEVTALRLDQRGLHIAAGTSSGHIAIYDIRRPKPLLIKDHQYGLPIIDLKYHSDDTHLVSSDKKIVKVWDKNSGAIFTTIQPPADINDVAIFPSELILSPPP